MNTQGTINLKGCGSGTWIEIDIEWEYEPAFGGDRIDPPYPASAENIRVTGWRWPGQVKFVKPDPVLEQVLAECIDGDWLLENTADDGPDCRKDRDDE